MFSVVDKKILISAIMALILVLLVGLAIYKYISRPIVDIQNVAGGVQIEQGESDALSGQN